MSSERRGPQTRRARRVARLVLAAWLAASAAMAGPVTGAVRTIVKPGAGPASAIVYAEPIDAAPPSRPGTFTLTQRNKLFLPRVLAVPVGSTVAFPNRDTIFHNVFSLSGPEPFDLGLYRAGASRSRTFTRAGAYRVFCNIHPQMSALIVVVPTPYVTLAGDDGRYTLDLPPGRYRVTALSERSAPASVEHAATAGASIAPAITLDESSWVEIPHRNKFGLDYPPDSYKR